jgi:hypothetical protein
MLNSLDDFVETHIITRYKKGIKPIKCVEYLRAITLNHQEKQASSQKRMQILRKKRKDAHKLGLRYTKIDDNYIRIKYIRFVDNFLLSVRGSKKLAEKILRTVKFFLKSDRHISINEKTSKIIHSYSNKIPFLKMLIYNITKTHIPYYKKREVENKKRKRNRILHRINVLQNRQNKVFRNECLNIFRKIYNEYRNNKDFLKEHFI